MLHNNIVDENYDLKSLLLLEIKYSLYFEMQMFELESLAYPIKIFKYKP
jgi:hypothetical protein